MAVENDGRRSLVKLMKTKLGLHAFAVESGDTEPGVPDLEFCGRGVGQGWIEVKRIAAWPKRASTDIRLPKGYLKRAQVTFMKRRIKAGGTCGLALQIGPRNWFMIRPEYVIDLYDRKNEAIVFERSFIENAALKMSSARGLCPALVLESILAIGETR